MKKIGSLIFVIGLMASTLVSAAVTVQSELDTEEVSVGEGFRVIVTVSATDNEDVETPKPGSMNQFDFQGMSQSTSSSMKMEILNGGVKYNKSNVHEFVFSYVAKNEGTFSIPGFEVSAGGKVLVSKPLEVKVLKAGTASNKRRAQPQQDPFQDETEEIFNQLLRRHGIGGRGFPQPQPQEKEPSLADEQEIKNPPKNPNETFSIRLEVDKTEVFEGEQIVANWYIYTRANILTLDRQKFPELRGFWKEIIEEVPALNLSQVIVNGIPYHRALLASHALFPIKSGTAVIDEYRVKAQVQVVDSTFGAFGFGKPYTFVRASERVPIKVKPLPTEGRPSNFAGAVGRFEVKAFVDGNSFPVNQPFSLRVRFEGDGNAKLIELPNLNLPNNLEVYSTKNDSKYYKNGRSYKEFEVLIIPRSEGDVKIPAMEFSIFDPVQKKYVQKTTQSIDVKIVPGNAAKPPDEPKGLLSGLTGKKDSADVMPSIILQSSVESPFKAWGAGLFWGSLFGTILIGAYVYYRKVFGTGSKRIKIKTKLISRISKLRPALAKNDYRKVGVEGVNLIYFVLGEISGQKSAGLELRKILEFCPPSLRNDQSVKLEKLMDDCQILGFAPEEIAQKLGDSKKLNKICDDLSEVLGKCCEYEDF